MNSHTERRRRELDDCVAKHIAVLEALRRTVADPRGLSTEISSLHEESMRLIAQETRLIAALRSDEQRGSLLTPRVLRGLTGERPLREDVLDTLDAIGVPAPPRLVSDVAAALGRRVPAERLASLRRDEERAYRRNPGARPQWIVPGINALNLVAIPRLVASSAWPAVARLVGIRSARVDHLRTLLSLTDRWERGLVSAHARPRLDALIRRLADSVANATDPGEELDGRRIREAVQAELAHVEPLDREERERAARLLSELPPDQQLWGLDERALREAEDAGVRRVFR